MFALQLAGIKCHKPMHSPITTLYTSVKKDECLDAKYACIFGNFFHPIFSYAESAMDIFKGKRFFQVVHTARHVFRSHRKLEHVSAFFLHTRLLSMHLELGGWQIMNTMAF
jgi:hypothetical protein